MHWASGFKSHRGDRERPPFTARRGIIATGHGACNASVDGKMAPSRQSSRPSCTRSDARSIATTFKRFHTRSRPSRTTAYLHRHRRRHLSHPPSRTPPARSQPARHSPLAYLRPCVLSFNSQRRNLPLLLSRLHSPLTVRIFLFGPKPTLFPQVFLWAPASFLINRALLSPKYDCLSAPQRAMQCAFPFAGRLDPLSGAGQMRLGSPPFRNLRSLSRAPRGKLFALLLEPRLSAGPSRPQIKSC